MTAPTNILSFEHWVAVRAWIDAGTDPKVVLSRIGLTQEAFQEAERVYVADLADESTRGDEELSVRFERAYDGAMASQTSLFASDDDDDGPTVPRALSVGRTALPTTPTTVEVTERLEHHEPPPAVHRLDQTVLLPSETALETPIETTGGILSHRILPFLETSATPATEQSQREILRPPPLDTDTDELVTLVAPPSRSLLQELSRPTDDAETAPSSARTMLGPRPTTIEQFAELLLALRNKEPRAAVLLRHGLTESALAAMALVWRERLRRDRVLFETFRDLMQRPPPGP